ncbi:hypothetical protein LRP30_33140 [Bradyrhizobium sp. C-145]|uniref:hypothetical protein n=1 Tax=unclassified Bradyrhizobium TaxID=2631580 RepID=UPI00201B92D6|nr:hypothetical protein [Bradyrhizobium sp. C-145]UQR61632.1 hypothetical protein LRP30_33140 [Bradyrhizobium sp. C-145]
MISFEPDTLYDWLSDYDSFAYAFKRYCFQITRALSLAIDFDSNTLKLVHEKWSADCEIWRTQHFPQDTEALSHAKVGALLLYNLALNPYISTVRLHDFNEELQYRFTGNAAQLEAARADLIAAREVVLAFDFCLAVICWYEENRVDRKELFVLRLTPELRHDILSYLVSRQTDPKAIYLILECLFIRSSN